VLLRSKKRSQRVEVPARRRCKEGRKERQETSSEVACCWRMRASVRGEVSMRGIGVWPEGGRAGEEGRRALIEAVIDSAGVAPWMSQIKRLGSAPL
jgi:hypothetical protein